MGSGLIWAGIGKGIADAGSTYGNMMFRAAEAELADQRALQKAEYLERLKAQITEEAAQRDAAKASEIGARAVKIGEERQVKAFDKLAESSALAGEQGDIPLSKEQLQQAVKNNPELGKQYRDMGLIEASQPLTRNEQRLQSADDELQAARELGASSTLLKSYQESKKTVLDEIRLENAARKGDQQHAATLAAITERGRQFDERKPILQQQADAATTRANRPAGGGGSGGAVKSMSEVKLNQEAETLRKAAKDASSMDARREYEARLREVMDEIQARRKGTAATSKPGDNRSSGSTTATTKNYSNLWK